MEKLDLNQFTGKKNQIDIQTMKGIIIAAWTEYNANNAKIEYAPAITIQKNLGIFAIDFEMYVINPANDQEKKLENSFSWIEVQPIAKLLSSLDDMFTWVAENENYQEDQEKWEEKFNNKD